MKTTQGGRRISCRMSLILFIWIGNGLGSVQCGQIHLFLSLEIFLP
jgi:hypothetical protein